MINEEIAVTLDGDIIGLGSERSEMLGSRAAFAGAELNALRERQVGREVDRVRLPAHARDGLFY